MNSRKVVPLRRLVALEERVRVARDRLQRTPETDPTLERQVRELIHLVRRRDDAVSPGDSPFPPAA